MRKIISSIMLIAVAAMAFVSCQKEDDAPVSESKSASLALQANVLDTKTYIENNSILWGEGEYVQLYFNDGEDKFVKSEEESANLWGGDESAMFSFEVSYNDQASSYVLGGIYPESAAVDKDNTKPEKYKVVLSDVQNASSVSYDPSAFIMIMKPMTVAASDFDKDAHIAYFRRAVALNKITLKGVKENITCVEIKAKNKTLAGRRYFDLKTGVEGEIYYDKSSTISVKGEYAAGDVDVWFTSWDAEIAEGESLEVVLKSDTKTYTKTITARADGIKFVEGGLNKLTIDMSEIKADQTDEPGETAAYYEKVTSEPADWSGKYLLIVEDNVNKALSGISTTSTKYGLGTDVIINANKINASGLSGYEVVISKASITDGAYILAFNSSLLYWNSGNSLATNSTESAKTNWTISLDNGKLSIYNCNTTNRQLLWNKTSPRFACYTGKEEDSGYYYPHLYKLVEDNEGGETTDPDQPKTPVLSVTPTEIRIVAAGGTGEINYTIENPVDGVSVDASLDVDWITNVSTTDGKVTFDVSENTGAERSAVVTLTYEGAESVNVTITQERSQSVTLPEGISSIKALATSTYEVEFAVTLTDAVVTYVSNQNAYIEDAEAGILIYQSGHNLSVGDKLNGEVTGKVKLYNNLREVISIDYTKATKTSDAAVPETVLTLEDLNAEGAYDKYENMRIKIVDATVSEATQISQDGQTYALYFKNKSLTGFDVDNIIDVIGYPSKYNSDIQLNVWENAIIKKVAKTTITGVSDFSVEVGDTKEINALASSGENVTYVSANPEIAKVDENGVVTGVAEGETTITVSVPANDIYPAAEETCTVTVTAAGETIDPVTATLSFANKAQRTSFSTSKQVWEQNEITLTNDKGSSTSNVADYANPARFYKSSKITVSAPGLISQIVFDCNSTTYATAMKSSITSGGTVTVSSDKVTVELTTPAEEFVVESLTGGQVRMDSLTVTYTPAN